MNAIQAALPEPAEGMCARCRQFIALTPDGRLAKHNVPGAFRNVEKQLAAGAVVRAVRCANSGMVPRVEG